MVQYGGFDRRFQFVLLYYMLENVVKAMLIKSKSTAFPVADPKGGAREILSLSWSYRQTFAK